MPPPPPPPLAEPAGEPSALAKPTRLAAAAWGAAEARSPAGKKRPGWRSGCGRGLQTVALVCAGRGGRLYPLPPPALRGCGPRPCPDPPERRKAGERAQKRRKSGRSPPPPSPPPSPRPPARKVRAAPGAGGGGERRAGSEPPPRASARWSSAPRPGGCLQTAPILWGRIRPGYAPPSRGRCCCCSSPPPPPAALSPSPRSLCGSHFSLSLLVVTRKAGQGTKNPRNFKWPLRASPLRVRAGSRPKGGGVRGPFPTSCRLVRWAFLWRSI